MPSHKERSQRTDRTRQHKVDQQERPNEEKHIEHAGIKSADASLLLFERAVSTVLHRMRKHESPRTPVNDQAAIVALESQGKQECRSSDCVQRGVNRDGPAQIPKDVSGPA
jgi:hypothetical protein